MEGEAGCGVAVNTCKDAAEVMKEFFFRLVGPTGSRKLRPEDAGGCRGRLHGRHGV